MHGDRARDLIRCQLKVQVDAGSVGLWSNNDVIHTVAGWMASWVKSKVSNLLKKKLDDLIVPYRDVKKTLHDAVVPLVAKQLGDGASSVITSLQSQLTYSMETSGNTLQFISTLTCDACSYPE